MILDSSVPNDRPSKVLRRIVRVILLLEQAIDFNPTKRLSELTVGVRALLTRS